MRKILSCIFSLLLFCGGLSAQDTTATVPADTAGTSEPPKPRRIDTIPWERSGLRVGIDLLKPILSFVNNQPQGAEFSLDYEVKKNYFAVLEAGWQQLELDEVRYNYTTKGMFTRLGVDYNFMKRRQPLSGEMAFVGIRYGFSSFSLQADSVLLTEKYWGDLLTSVPKTTLQGHWAELLLGVKAEISENLFLGWTIRAGFLVAGGVTKREVVPIRVPGYGRTEKKPVFGFTYSVYYRF
ncbi:DUF6048 family protein [Anseongella ginsenosidimutans]|uniref:DUF6048 family protein n=1 Tax=Anseongella ginsenosidimutans TaxID=496056 RepID=UPI001049F702|nr:DUF6048 family protein [Anseongella ginsenosidimutans]QEC52628.1 hypothetical protein FRZ59_09950 [Anseongella ginsenosidimutans]